MDHYSHGGVESKNLSGNILLHDFLKVDQILEKQMTTKKNLHFAQIHTRNKGILKLTINPKYHFNSKMTFCKLDTNFFEIIKLK
ncbi:hypothetical protein BpHYR1_037416 [Brachionus plicatilis]|uniref:Uncharacterized protein n=1 Tax=Brachionus plicatilis TaxID=10195 RepID=A0A3M7SQ42_BRAPC|nr:hypothetical protein BpHYR1_037416 [Brachionus plicatilis]